MRKTLIFIFTLLVFLPLDVFAQTGRLKILERTLVYARPSFESEIIGTLEEGEFVDFTSSLKDKEVEDLFWYKATGFGWITSESTDVITWSAEGEKKPTKRKESKARISISTKTHSAKQKKSLEKEKTVDHSLSQRSVERTKKKQENKESEYQETEGSVIDLSLRVFGGRVTLNKVSHTYDSADTTSEEWDLQGGMNGLNVYLGYVLQIKVGGFDTGLEPLLELGYTSLRDYGSFVAIPGLFYNLLFSEGRTIVLSGLSYGIGSLSDLGYFDEKNKATYFKITFGGKIFTGPYGFLGVEFAYYPSVNLYGVTSDSGLVDAETVSIKEEHSSWHIGLTWSFYIDPRSLKK